MDKKQTTEVNTSTQEYFRPAEAAEYLGISTRTLYSLLSSGKLHAIKLTARVTLISKREMEQMIERTIGASLSESIFSKGRSGSFSSDVSHVKEKATSSRGSKRSASDRAPAGVTHDTHYTMAEICAKYDYSYGRFYTLRMRYGIPKVHAFGTSCFPKETVDQTITQEQERLGKTLREHWYTCGELMRIYGLGKTQVRRFAVTHHVRTKRANGNRLYYLKEDWEAERRIAEDKSTSTKEKREGAN